MFIPIHDKNPLTIVAFQYVTLAIIILCVTVYLWQSSLDSQALQLASYQLGLIPSVLLDLNSLPPQAELLPAQATLFSYMFLHGSWVHLLGNMLFLWVFGDNIEDSMGHLRFIFFYLLCGLAAGLAHGLMEPASSTPMIGASGAIAGLLGAYLVLHPRVRVLVLLFSRIPLHLPAYLLILAWGVFQWYGASFSAEGDHTAWWAHIGGFVAGIILIVPMKYRRAPLFDRGVEH